MNIGDFIGLGILGVLIGIGTVFDIKTKTIPLVLPAVGLIGLLACLLMPCSINGAQRLIGCLPGLLLSIPACMKRGIGIGDSMLVLLVGATVGIGWLCLFLLISFFGMMAVSAGLLIRRKVKKNDTLPFYPFAAAGYVAMTMTIFMRVLEVYG